MAFFLTYVFFALLILLFGLLVTFNFVRYRFKGDRTWFFVGLVVVLSVIDVLFTFSLLRPA